MAIQTEMKFGAPKDEKLRQRGARYKQGLKQAAKRVTGRVRQGLSSAVEKKSVPKILKGAGTARLAYAGIDPLVKGTALATGMSGRETADMFAQVEEAQQRASGLRRYIPAGVDIIGRGLGEQAAKLSAKVNPLFAIPNHYDVMELNSEKPGTYEYFAREENSEVDVRILEILKPFRWGG